MRKQKINSGLQKLLSSKEEEEVQDDVEKMRETHRLLEQRVFSQEDILARMSSESLIHACVVSVNNKIVPERYELNDLVLITDEESPHYDRIGRILKRNDSEILVDVAKLEEAFVIGQVKLLFKNDGRTIVLAFGNEVFEVWGSNFKAQPGDTAKIGRDSRQIVEIIPSIGIGEVCVVEDVYEEYIKVTSKTKGTRLVVCCFKVEKGNEVVLDSTASVAIKYLVNKNEK